MGKTTLAFHLVHAFAPDVLAIDTDPQANLTSRFTKELPPESNIRAMYDREPCTPMQTSGIHLVGSDITLSMKETEGRTETAHYLRRTIERKWSEYRYCVIDVPPQLSLFFSSALIAADWLVIPVSCDDFSPVGLDGLIARVQDMKDTLDLKVRIAGILVNQVRESTKYAQGVIADLRGKYGKAVFDTVIPESVRVTEAVAQRQPVWVTAPHSKPAKAYLAFIQELKAVING